MDNAGNKAKTAAEANERSATMVVVLVVACGYCGGKSLGLGLESVWCLVSSQNAEENYGA